MAAIQEILTNGSSDPMQLALMVLAVWVPLCAVLLLLLWGVARLQVAIERRRPRRPAVVVPPADVRPLAARRYVTSGSRSGAALNTARVTAVLALVAGLTAFLLVTNAPALRAALAGAG
jgi:hypothetical protein